MGGILSPGMAVFGGEEGVVVVEFPHRRAVGPGRPFRMHPHVGAEAEHGRAAGAGVGQRLIARRRHRMAIDGGHRYRGVIDDAVDDHLGNGRLDLDRVGRHLRDLPGELAVALQPIRLGMHPNLVVDHGCSPADVAGEH